MMLRPITRTAPMAAVLVMAAGFFGPAEAGYNFDFETFTCRDFMRATEPGQAALALWLSGHSASGPEAARRDLSEILEVVPALRAACAESRSAKLAGVFEQEERRRAAEGGSE